MRTPYTFKKTGKGPPPGMVNALVLGSVYGYFALKMHKDAADCYANETSDQAVDETNNEQMKDAVNIGNRF